LTTTVQVTTEPDVSTVNVTGAQPRLASPGRVTVHVTVTFDRNQPEQSAGAGEHA
jgi:hypothetical protein